MPAERKIISHLCAPVWGRLDAYNEEWKNLDGPGSQAVLDSYINKIRACYKEMHRISESMTKRLGQRKTVVLNSPVIQRISKRDMKNKKTNDLLVLFSKSDLTSLPRGAKAIFEPAYAGAVLPDMEALNIALTGMTVHTLGAGRAQHLASCDGGKRKALEWELWWLDSFQPSQDYNRNVDIPKDVLAATNMFVALQGMES